MPTRRDIIHLVRVPDQFINQRGGESISQQVKEKKRKGKTIRRPTPTLGERYTFTSKNPRTSRRVSHEWCHTHTYIYVINITQATDTLEDGSEAGRKLFLLSQLFGVG